MENYQGDLADIIRASGGGGATTGSLTSSIQLQGQLPSSDGVTDWQFIMNNNNQIDNHNPLDEFGDPFCNARDPLFQVQVHDMAAAAPSCNFFNTSSTTTTTSSCSTDNIIIRSNNNNNIRVVSPKIGDEEEIIVRRAASENVFSRMLQISPNAKLSTRDSPALAVSPKPPSLTATNEMISSTVNNSLSKASFVENGGLQISSPRSTGIKRRKCQAKKVVCIPAPTPANSSRTSGEVVPSDLWAWRKYGQKPIKGSPYPRGYYRCSSSKGCSARKQVERSRTDPNMLVITYTSEHNHPWPTQRNALAGSTRSQPSKTSGSASKTSSSLTGGSQQSQRSTNLKEEQKEISLITDTDNISSSIVKEEMEDLDHNQMAEMDDVEFSQGFQQSYKPSLPLPDSNRSEDFFADLGELEADPLNLLFAQAYSGEEQGRRNKAPPPLDPLFSFYDWTDNNSNHNNSNNYSIEEDSNKGS